MLLVSETAARRIWLANPNFSISGKHFTRRYIAFRNSRAARYTSKSSNVEPWRGCLAADSRFNDSRFTISPILLNHFFQIVRHFRQRFQSNFHVAVPGLPNHCVYLREALVLVG